MTADVLLVGSCQEVDQTVRNEGLEAVEDMEEDCLLTIQLNNERGEG